MKIEVGKTYYTRSGRKVDIVGKYGPPYRNYPYIGMHRNAEGLIVWMDHYKEDGVSSASTSADDLVPPKERFHRYYGFFRMADADKTKSPKVMFASCGSKEAWEGVKAEYEQSHVLLKEGYDFVDIEL